MPRRLEHDFATQHIFSVITCFHFFLLCSHLQLTERGWRRVYKNLSTHFSHHFKVGCTRCCITYFYLKISHIMLLILGPQTESLGKFLLHTKVREPCQKGLRQNIVNHDKIAHIAPHDKINPHMVHNCLCRLI